MARISLLFTLTIILAISSVLSHPPSHEKSTQKTLCPPMLSGLQSFPHIQIEEFLEKTAKSASNTPQFQVFWAVCKAFDDQLAAFRIDSAKEVVGSAKAKCDLVSKAFLQAQQFFGIGAASEFAVNLKKNFEKVAENYLVVVEKVGKFSAKYKFDVAAKISEIDRAEMDKCVLQLKGAIRVFLKMAMDKKMSFEKSSGFVMDPIGSFGVIAKKGLEHGSNLVGGFAGHGQAGAGFGAGAKAGAHAGGNAGGIFGFNSGAKAGAQAGGNAGGIFGFNAGAKAGAQAGGNAGGIFGFNSGAKAGAQAGGNAGGIFGLNAGAKAGAHAGGNFGGLFGFNAAGKAKFVGGDGFKPLKSNQAKHLD